MRQWLRAFGSYHDHLQAGFPLIRRQGMICAPEKAIANGFAGKGFSRQIMCDAGESPNRLSPRAPQLQPLVRVPAIWRTNHLANEPDVAR